VLPGVMPKQKAGSPQWGPGSRNERRESSRCGRRKGQGRGRTKQCGHVVRVARGCQQETPNEGQRGSKTLFDGDKRDARGKPSRYEDSINGSAASLSFRLELVKLPCPRYHDSVPTSHTFQAPSRVAAWRRFHGLSWSVVSGLGKLGV